MIAKGRGTPGAAVPQRRGGSAHWVPGRADVSGGPGRAIALDADGGGRVAVGISTKMSVSRERIHTPRK